MTKTERLVADIEALSRFAQNNPDLGITTDAALVRAQVDEDALVRIVDAITEWAETEMGWRELKPREKDVVRSMERLDKQMPFIRRHRDEIRAGLGMGPIRESTSQGPGNPQVEREA